MYAKEQLKRATKRKSPEVSQGEPTAVGGAATRSARPSTPPDTQAHTDQERFRKEERPGHWPVPIDKV